MKLQRSSRHPSRPGLALPSARACAGYRVVDGDEALAKSTSRMGADFALRFDQLRTSRRITGPAGEVDQPV